MEDLKIVNWLKDSKYRIQLLKLLNLKPHLPSEIATKLDTDRSTISRILQGLKKKELVIGIQDGSRTITYILSEKGRDIYIQLENAL